MIQDIGSYTSIGESILFGADYQRVYSVRIDLITPEKAKEMLEKNINRKLNMNRVNQYVDDMKSDRWKLNGVPIIITDDGYLKDGQHRLNALIKADMSIPFVVIRYSKNFEIEANNYDIGMTRSVSDLRILSGKDSTPSHISATMNFILRYNSENHKAPLKSVCAEEIDKNAEYLFILNEARKGPDGKGNKAAYWAAIVTAYKNGYSKEKLIEFNKVFQSGIMDKPEHQPIVLLRNRLFQKHVGGDYASQVDTYLRTQSALKYFETGNIINKTFAKEFYKWEDNNHERN